MAESELQRQQGLFAAWLRDPQAHPPPPGVEARRLQVYRDLFAGSIEGLLAPGFPDLRRRLGDAGWTSLVARFYATHRCHTPYFTRVGGEFVEWLEEQPDLPPWLHPLAHFERMVTELQFDDAKPPPCDADGDLLAGTPVLSPLVRVLAYAFPVHRADALADVHFHDAPILLLLRRAADGTVATSELSPPMYRLLELLDAGQATGGQVLRSLAAEAGLSDIDGFLAQGRAMLERLRAEGVICGTTG